MSISSWLRRQHTGLRESIAEVERESIEYRQSRDPSELMLHVFGVVIVASFALSLQSEFGSSNDYGTLESVVTPFVDAPKAFVQDVFRKGPYSRLYRLLYWVAATSFCYFVLPALYIKVIMRERLRDFGFQIKGALKHSWIYIGLYLFVLPALFVVGQTKSFQSTYPFYEHASRSALDFFSWESAYALQFLCLEFFFRGFLVHSMKKQFGVYCIIIGIMPYCMIHFGKPLPETLGAIFAGLALGLLSLLTRSIWLGVAIHVSVAVSMDIISLWLQGKLF